MLPNSYFESIIKHKNYSNDAEVALMTPTQASAYRITGHIKRKGNVASETKYLNKMIKHLQRKVKIISKPIVINGKPIQI